MITLKIHADVLAEIKARFAEDEHAGASQQELTESSQMIFESGGVLMGQDDCIERFIFDQGKADKSGEFVPDHHKVNKEIEVYSDQGFSFIGLIHSHMARRVLSHQDLIYAKSLMEANGIDEIYMFLFIMESRELLGFHVNKNLQSIPITLSTI